MKAPTEATTPEKGKGFPEIALAQRTQPRFSSQVGCIPPSTRRERLQTPPKNCKQPRENKEALRPSVGPFKGKGTHRAQSRRMNDPSALRCRVRSQHRYRTRLLSHITRSRFRHFLALFAESFAPFDRSTCTPSVSRPYFALRWGTPRRSSFNPKKVYSWVHRGTPDHAARRLNGFLTPKRTVTHVCTPFQAGNCRHTAFESRPLCPTSCSATTGSRPLHQCRLSRKDISVATGDLSAHGVSQEWDTHICRLFTRRYWSNHRCFLLLCRLVCLSWAGRSARHQVRKASIRKRVTSPTTRTSLKSKVSLSPPHADRTPK